MASKPNIRSLRPPKLLCTIVQMKYTVSPGVTRCKVPRSFSFGAATDYPQIEPFNSPRHIVYLLVQMRQTKLGIKKSDLQNQITLCYIYDPNHHCTQPLVYTFHIFFWDVALNKRLACKPKRNFSVKLTMHTVQADTKLVQHVPCGLGFPVICNAEPGNHL